MEVTTTTAGRFVRGMRLMVKTITGFELATKFRLVVRNLTRSSPAPTFEIEVEIQFRETDRWFTTMPRSKSRECISNHFGGVVRFLGEEGHMVAIKATRCYSAMERMDHSESSDDFFQIMIRFQVVGEDLTTLFHLDNTLACEFDEVFPVTRWLRSQ